MTKSEQETESCHMPLLLVAFDPVTAMRCMEVLRAFSRSQKSRKLIELDESAIINDELIAPGEECFAIVANVSRLSVAAKVDLLRVHGYVVIYVLPEILTLTDLLGALLSRNGSALDKLSDINKYVKSAWTAQCLSAECLFLRPEEAVVRLMEWSGCKESHAPSRLAGIRLAAVSGRNVYSPREHRHPESRALHR